MDVLIIVGEVTVPERLAARARRRLHIPSGNVTSATIAEIRAHIPRSIGVIGDAADLAATAGGWRRLASWAASRELAAVAQIASRAAARDQDIGTGEDGRPARVPASAAAEVALELTMSRYGAAGWADLAVELGWRLAATGAALESGDIDVYRARLIAEATGPLSDEAARAVEEKVLPAAGRQTPGMLRAALRRAVLTADPKGAEERRKESERQAKVVLYPDEDHTATLAGQPAPLTLPGGGAGSHHREFWRAGSRRASM